MNHHLDRWFGVSDAGSTVRTEVTAGVTTFLTMAYIAVVNPSILQDAGMPAGAVLTATCIAAALGSLIMGLLGRLPIGLAPGMGINAYFAYYVCGVLKYPWQTALGAVFLSGLLFLVLTWTGLRERIIEAIPESMKHAVAAGIGIFIAFIGLKNAGIVVDDSTTLVRMGNVVSRPVLVTFAGLVISGALLARKVRGALLFGIVLSTGLAILLGVAEPPAAVVSVPPSLEPTLLALDLSAALELGLVHLVFTFAFVDLFDSIATLVGVAEQGGFMEEQEDGRTHLPRATWALTADAVATMVGAMLGTSTTTAYIESTAGIAEGGRTGLVATVVAICFVLLLFFSPLIAAVPPHATAPALVLVAVFMLSSFVKITFDDFTEAVPAIVACLTIPLTFSISNGLAVGFITYPLVKILAGRYKDVTIVMYLLAILFIVKFMFLGE